MVCDVLWSRIYCVVNFDACGTSLVLPETIFFISLEESVSVLYVFSFMSGSAPGNIVPYIVSCFMHHIIIIVPQQGSS